MSDGRDARNQDDGQHDRLDGDDLRLHRAEVLRSKVPPIWEAVLDQIADDLETHNREYPNDASRQGRLIRQGETSVLKSTARPPRTIALILDLDRACIQVKEATAEGAAGEEALEPREPIKLEVDRHDEVSFVFHGSHPMNPAHFAEKLVQHLLKFD